MAPRSIRVGHRLIQSVSITPSPKPTGIPDCSSALSLLVTLSSRNAFTFVGFRNITWRVSWSYLRYKKLTTNMLR